MKPLANRVLVLPQPVEKKTKSGIYIPDTATSMTAEQPCRGVVKAIGEGRITDAGIIIPITVKIGDCVLYNQRAGYEVETDGENYLLMRDDDLMAVL